MKKENARINIPPLLLEGDEPSTPAGPQNATIQSPEPPPHSEPPPPEPKAESPAPPSAPAAAIPPPPPEAPFPTAAPAPEPPHAEPPSPPPPPAHPNLESDVTLPIHAEAPGPPTAPAPAVSQAEPAELPESYGTGKLHLIPRDPHWLYAHWDIPPEQQRQYNELSASNHLLVRVQPETAAAPVKEIPVHPDSRHWFVHVDLAATDYSAQLGYYQPDGQWQTVASAPAAGTPPEVASPNRAIQFATIDVDSPPPPLQPETPAAESAPAGQFIAAPRTLEPIRPHRVGWFPAFDSNLDLAAQIRQLESSDVASFWTPEKEQALAAMLRVHRQTIDSLTLAEWLGETPNISSPIEQPQPAPPNFWLNVNAELVIYGATEPSATVMIAGQIVPLRDDGTFSLRVALPDGHHELPVLAVSAQGDSRDVQLRFSRQTQFGNAP
jgi:uncharacterized protein